MEKNMQNYNMMEVLRFRREASGFRGLTVTASGI